MHINKNSENHRVGSFSKWLIDQFKGEGECSTPQLTTHRFNTDQSGCTTTINLQKLVCHGHPHKFDTPLIRNPNDGFSKDLIELARENSQIVDLYVAMDGLFPGGHGMKKGMDSKRRIIPTPLGQAVSFVFGTRGIIQKERMCFLSSDEKYYIYQMDSRVLGEEFWATQRSKSDLQLVENLHSQLVGASPFYRNVWISSDQALTPIHYDTSDNLFVQMLGKKHVILWKPEDKELLYLNGEDHPISDRQTNIDLTLEPSELAKQFPQFFQSKPVRITLEPGDVMFIPRGWPHMVLTDGHSISVNYWWINEAEKQDIFQEEMFSNMELFSEKPLGEIKSLDDLPTILESEQFLFGSKKLYPVPAEYAKYYHSVSGQSRDYYCINHCSICESRYHLNNCPKEDEIYLKSVPKSMSMSMVRPTYEPRNQKLVTSVSSVTNALIGDKVFSSTCLWRDKIVFIGGPRASPRQMIQFVDINNGNVSAPSLKNSEGKFVTETKWGHSSTCVNDKIYIFGGFDSQYQYNDLICFDINSNTVSTVKTKGDAPSARAFHSATYIKNSNSLLIFGGQVCSGGPYQYFNDMYLLDLYSFSWKKITPTKNSQTPEPRSQHSSILLVDKNHLLVFGGSNSTTWFSEIHTFDLKNLVWKSIYPYANKPRDVNFEAKNFRIHPTPQSIVEINESTVAFIGFCDKGKGEILLFDHNELSLRKSKQSVGCVLGSFSSKANTIHVVNTNQQVVEFKFDKVVLNSECPTSDPFNWENQ